MKNKLLYAAFLSTALVACEKYSDQQAGTNTMHVSRNALLLAGYHIDDSIAVQIDEAGAQVDTAFVQDRGETTDDVYIKGRTACDEEFLLELMDFNGDGMHENNEVYYMQKHAVPVDINDKFAVWFDPDSTRNPGLGLKKLELQVGEVNLLTLDTTASYFSRIAGFSITSDMTQKIDTAHRVKQFLQLPAR